MHRYPYVIKLDGQTVAGFSEVSGLTTDTNVAEYRDGSDATSHPRKSSGLSKFTDVTLKRGVVHDAGFAAWLKQPRGPRHLTIEGYDAGGRLVWSHLLMNCTVREHRSKGASMIETITLASHHRPS